METNDLRQPPVNPANLKPPHYWDRVWPPKELVGTDGTAWRISSSGTGENANYVVYIPTNLAGYHLSLDLGFKNSWTDTDMAHISPQPKPPRHWDPDTKTEDLSGWDVHIYSPGVNDAHKHINAGIQLEYVRRPANPNFNPPGRQLATNWKDTHLATARQILDGFKSKVALLRSEQNEKASASWDKQIEIYDTELREYNDYLKNEKEKQRLEQLKPAQDCLDLLQKDPNRILVSFGPNSAKGNRTVLWRDKECIVDQKDLHPAGVTFDFAAVCRRKKPIENYLRLLKLGNSVAYVLVEKLDGLEERAASAAAEERKPAARPATTKKKGVTELLLRKFGDLYIIDNPLQQTSRILWNGLDGLLATRITGDPPTGSVMIQIENEISYFPPQLTGGLPGAHANTLATQVSQNERSLPDTASKGKKFHFEDSGMRVNVTQISSLADYDPETYKYYFKLDPGVPGGIVLYRVTATKPVQSGPPIPQSDPAAVIAAPPPLDLTTLPHVGEVQAISNDLQWGYAVDATGQARKFKVYQGGDYSNYKLSLATTEGTQMLVLDADKIRTVFYCGFGDDRRWWVTPDNPGIVLARNDLWYRLWAIEPDFEISLDGDTEGLIYDDTGVLSTFTYRGLTDLAEDANGFDYWKAGLTALDSTLVDENYLYRDGDSQVYKMNPIPVDLSPSEAVSRIAEFYLCGNDVVTLTPYTQPYQIQDGSNMPEQQDSGVATYRVRDLDSAPDPWSDTEI